MSIGTLHSAVARKTENATPRKPQQTVLVSPSGAPVSSAALKGGGNMGAEAASRRQRHADTLVALCFSGHPPLPLPGHAARAARIVACPGASSKSGAQWSRRVRLPEVDLTRENAQQLLGGNSVVLLQAWHRENGRAPCERGALENPHRASEGSPKTLNLLKWTNIETTLLTSSQNGFGPRRRAIRATRWPRRSGGCASRRQAACPW